MPYLIISDKALLKIYAWFFICKKFPEKGMQR